MFHTFKISVINGICGQLHEPDTASPRTQSQILTGEVQVDLRTYVDVTTKSRTSCRKETELRIYTNF
jgi:hypothetical protein